MGRITVTETDEQGETTVLGWFDPDQSEMFESGWRWTGDDRVQAVTGSSTEFELLYRTPGGRWVVDHWSQWMGRPETYWFLTDEQARDWLMRSGRNEAAVRRFWPETPDEAGPGRPPIEGPTWKIKLPRELASRIEGSAKRQRVSRAAWIRAAAQSALDAEERGGGPESS
ncbi:ribbon-helix-helix domain-containing protein [Propionibacterium australiense]|uniref:Uncharacterized protein n=1 Tax=Propionibacterium australiense TaxID=119981 RepID=A0A8B3FIN8_9ACTN|nr:CopG family transcriptional regulator [Propionibacterium australiense]RLP08913.1 hypothetical protein D7U36_08885 [Propionibacterium australiense]